MRWRFRQIEALGKLDRDALWEYETCYKTSLPDEKRRMLHPAMFLKIATARRVVATLFAREAELITEPRHLQLIFYFTTRVKKLFRVWVWPFSVAVSVKV